MPTISGSPFAHALRPVLIVDGEAEDLIIAKRNLAKAGIENPIVTFDGGESVLAFLKATCSRSDGIRPCLLVLAGRMSKVDAFQVLDWARKQGALDGMKVVLHSTAHLPEDVARATALGVDGFLTKPVEPAQWFEIVPH
jgi:CheY-like chemotaxis protein